MPMRVSDTVHLALGALTAHKMRTVLTLLGLVIGVMSLILVVTLIQGANLYVEQKIANLGTDIFQVAKLPLVPTDFEEFTRAFKNRDIEQDDLEAVAAACARCAAVGAEVSTLGRVWSETDSLPDINIRGQTANMGSISTLDIATGRFFSDGEQRASVPVAILGDNVRDRLFKNRDPLGKTVRVSGELFHVIGTAERIGEVLGQPQDDFVIIPLSAYQKLFGLRHSLVLQVQGRPPIETAQDEVRHILRGRRHLAPAARDDFYFATAETYMSLYRDISSVFFVVFVLISSVASIVGGIVIMNITLVSVYERTKEIGLRRSVGATQRDIARQFLVEVLAQCLAGGATGVALGFGIALLLRQFTPFPADVEIRVALLGLLMSSIIALVFGVYPAIKAAKLDPVVALRTE
jgi:putative ABC transport system permease protein